MIEVVAFVVVAGLIVPGAIGAFLARRWGYGAWMGFAAGALGGIGGSMLVAALPRRRTAAEVRARMPNETARQRTLDVVDRGAHAVYRILAVMLVVLNLVWLVTTMGLVPGILGFEPLVYAEPGVPVRGLDFAMLGLMAVLGLLCVYTAAADRRLTSGERAGWIAALVVTLSLASFVYVPWRRARILAA